MAIGLVFAGLSASSRCQFCHKEKQCCLVSAGSNGGWTGHPIDSRRSLDNSNISFRCRNPLFGATQFHWLATGQDPPLSNVQVAADDYSDSTLDSSEYIARRGYHPLEELRKHERSIGMLLTNAEIARTTVEANSKGLLVFPGRVHCEPHGHASWAEYQYIVDDYGDIFFELFDDESILQDRHASNLVSALIGMNNSICGENRIASRNYIDHSGSDSAIDILSAEDYEKIINTDVTDALIKRGMPDTMRYIHPMYFSKCLAKSVNTKHAKKMEFPSNGIYIVGCLRPAFMDEETYIRRLFHHEDGDGYLSDWRDESEKEEEHLAGTSDLIDDEILKFGRRGHISSTLYKLEIMSMDLFSVYGVQFTISSQDFQDAEPDLLAHSSSAIIERLNGHGMHCSVALQALCRKRKDLIVERADIIGVDTLGMDVRVSSGMEMQTLRFSFNSRALTESAAEKKIKRMLFPRYQRKGSRTHNDGIKDLTSL